MKSLTQCSYGGGELYASIHSFPDYNKAIAPNLHTHIGNKAFKSCCGSNCGVIGCELVTVWDGL